MAEKLKEIPGEATDVTKNAPQEFSELEFMAKAKMIKAVASTVSKIKDKCEEVADEMKNIKQDIEDMKECIERMRKEIEEETLIELGKKCRNANKNTIKDCYECAFAPIKAAKAGAAGPGGQDGAKGCCTTF